MTCKCDKEKFREEFKKEIDNAWHFYNDSYEQFGDEEDAGKSDGILKAEKIFNNLWNKYMEDKE